MERDGPWSREAGISCSLCQPEPCDLRPGMTPSGPPAVQEQGCRREGWDGGRCAALHHHAGPGANALPVVSCSPPLWTDLSFGNKERQEAALVCESVQETDVLVFHS